MMIEDLALARDVDVHLTWQLQALIVGEKEAQLRVWGLGGVDFSWMRCGEPLELGLEFVWSL